MSLSWSGNLEAKKQADAAWQNLCNRRNRRRGKVTKEQKDAKRLQKQEQRKITKARKDEYYVYMHSKAWKRKRAEAIAHYGKVCCRCGFTKRLNVHHKTYINFRNEAMEDLEVLCRMCHEVEHDAQYHKDIQRRFRQPVIDKRFQQLVASF